MEGYKQVLSMDTLKFVAWLDSEFSYDMPTRIETPDDVNYGLDCMAAYAGANEYLESLASYAKIVGRSLKRMGKEYKKDYEDMVDKREAIDNKIDAIKLSYQTVNKSVTIAVEEIKNPHIFAK